MFYVKGILLYFTRISSFRKIVTPSTFIIIIPIFSRKKYYDIEHGSEMLANTVSVHCRVKGINNFIACFQRRHVRDENIVDTCIILLTRNKKS